MPNMTLYLFYEEDKAKQELARLKADPQMNNYQYKELEIFGMDLTGVSVKLGNESTPNNAAHVWMSELGKKVYLVTAEQTPS